MALFQFEYTPQNLTISAIHAFYSRERKLYSRLVFDLHMDPVRSMEIIAFWLWLEEKEKPDIIVNMSSSDDPTLLTAALVARDFIATLRMNTPFEGLNIGFEQKSVQGIKHHLNSVCLKALSDLQKKAEELVHRHQIEMLVSQMSRASLHPVNFNRSYMPNSGEGSSHSSNSFGSNSQLSGIVHTGREIELGYPFNLGMSADMARIGQELAVIPRNAYSGIVRADPELPLTDYVPDDERTLFVTFSNGYPLTKQELQSFFMRYFGDVESVHIQTSNGGRPPQYAYVTFCTLQTVFRVLNGTQKAKFIINGKHLWARRYIPRRNHPNNDANRGASRFSAPQTQTF